MDRLQALLSKKLGPEYLSTRPGGGSTTLTYIEGWRVINLANEVFGYNGESYPDLLRTELTLCPIPQAGTPRSGRLRSISSVLVLSQHFCYFADLFRNMMQVDFDPETRRYCMGVSAIVRVRLQDGASHEDIGYGKLENSKSKADGLDKVSAALYFVQSSCLPWPSTPKIPKADPLRSSRQCKKEAVTDALKRTLRNFGSLLGNCLYDKQYTAAVGNVKSKKVGTASRLVD